MDIWSGSQGAGFCEAATRPLDGFGHWEDVDLEAGTLRVRRTLAQTNDGPMLSAPKSAKSRRRIKLAGAAVGALTRHRAAQNAERLRLGGFWEDRGLVFPNRNGGFLSPYLLTDGPLKRPLERAGLPPIRFHDLRHTCATILLSRGVHAKLVQELLGHATISITLDTYSHVLPGVDDGLADTPPFAAISEVSRPGLEPGT